MTYGWAEGTPQHVIDAHNEKIERVKRIRDAAGVRFVTGGGDVWDCYAFAGIVNLFFHEAGFEDAPTDEERVGRKFMTNMPINEALRLAALICEAASIAAEQDPQAYPMDEDWRLIDAREYMDIE